ncbi:hypothetical protein [Metallosphaera hakonensis]|uniref:hypothetical protein n=1 Tax=Metallosphaera hakonensis TaxID=79601 RepID=UPI00144333BC|nr:hypothetical protein [Metallosphaera hakonensis]
MSKKLQELLEEFFRAKDDQELSFHADEETLRKLDLILRAFSQESKIENGKLTVRKRRP